MQPHRIIPTLDVAEAGHLGLGLGCEPAAAEQLGLEGGEEALGHGVVEASPTDPIEGRTPASPHRLPNATEVYWAESTGRRNTTGRNVAMAGRRRSDRALRDKLRSPGRPGMARREDRLRFWALIAAGLSSEDAAIGAGVSPPVGTRWFREAGGMPSSTFAPSSKPLSGRYLAFAEREEIALALAQDFGVREIARRLGRAASTVSRELRRNAATRSGGLEYRASTAQWHAERSARRPKRAKLAINAALRAYVQDRLAGVVVAPGGTPILGPAVRWKSRRHGPRQKRRWGMAWSPEQIAQRLRHDFPGDETMQISHEPALNRAL